MLYRANLRAEFRLNPFAPLCGQKDSDVIIEQSLIPQGRRVTLRPMTAEDAPAMFASLSDAEAMRLTGTQAVYSLADVTAHLHRCERDRDRYDFAIELEQALIGEVTLNNIDWLNRCAAFRIALWRDQDRNQGLGSEAAALTLRFAFETLGLNRVELDVYDFNPRARHVYARLGFRHEGTRRAALCWEGEWVDCHIMGLLQAEYLSARGAS